ncbi:hypothetical protein OF83DRAFT_1056421 [Amylostereum chailletii]|nr:hypothetical protein OF83DRAFT_1056421 [Amylostereum chailletii]
MFSSLGLFHSNLPCPHKPSCERPYCLFSHSPHVVQAPIVVKYAPPIVAAPSTTIPAKRPAAGTASPARSLAASTSAASSSRRRLDSSSAERPTKLQRVGTAARPVALPTASHTPTGAPVLRVNAAQSKVPVNARQTMLQNLYDHFVVLYDAVLPQQPGIAAEHALRQEEEIYTRSSKVTYRNAIISSIATLKTRPIPTHPSHPSVGTAGDLATRAALASSISSQRITPSQLAPLILTKEEMQQWGYVVDIPEAWGKGGDYPNAEGARVKCDRCSTIYSVRPFGHNDPRATECTYHWGKIFFPSINGERTKTYTCCSRPVAEGGGCTRGPHVFYESDPAMLHARHAFSTTGSTASSPNSKKRAPLDIVALDCEMVYTTGGSRIARVSVVDVTGKAIFDECVKMDETVEILDYITRFSGLTPEGYAARAKLPLRSIRRLLSGIIDSQTIILGHGLENDLKTLRMVHNRVIDTAALFVHPRGWPYRRALRDLAKEHLSRSIQTGGAALGHSSIEDSVATLDLVKWFVLNKKTKPSLTTPPPGVNGFDKGGRMTGSEPFIQRARAMGIAVGPAVKEKGVLPKSV